MGMTRKWNGTEQRQALLSVNIRGRLFPHSCWQDQELIEGPQRHSAVHYSRQERWRRKGEWSLRHNFQKGASDWADEIHDRRKELQSKNHAAFKFRLSKQSQETLPTWSILVLCGTCLPGYRGDHLFSMRNRLSPIVIHPYCHTYKCCFSQEDHQL